jgi:hypothetical protein
MNDVEWQLYLVQSAMGARKNKKGVKLLLHLLILPSADDFSLCAP